MLAIPFPPNTILEDKRLTTMTRCTTFSLARLIVAHRGGKLKPYHLPSPHLGPKAESPLQLPAGRAYRNLRPCIQTSHLHLMLLVASTRMPPCITAAAAGLVEPRGKVPGHHTSHHNNLAHKRFALEQNRQGKARLPLERGQLHGFATITGLFASSSPQR